MAAPGGSDVIHHFRAIARQRRRAAQAVAAVLAGLAVEDGISFREFCSRLAAQRGRPITVVPIGALVGFRTPPFSGLWIKAPHSDYVFYDDTAAPLTQRHAVFHEIGHMSLDHLADGELDQGHLQLMRQVLPDLDPVAIRNSVRPGLCRSHYADRTNYNPRQEVEAEEFATQLAVRLTQANLITPVRAVDPLDSAAIARFITTLGPRGEAP